MLQLAAAKEIAQAPTDADPKSNRNAAGQKLVMDETQRLLSKFLEAERSASEYRHTPVDEAIYARLTDLVKELLSGFQNMGAEHLKEMSWINPILLGSCIQSNNGEIRFAVQKLVRSTTPGSTTPYPTPQKSGSGEGEDEKAPPEAMAATEAPPSAGPSADETESGTPDSSTPPGEESLEEHAIESEEQREDVGLNGEGNTAVEDTDVAGMNGDGNIEENGEEVEKPGADPSVEPYEEANGTNGHADSAEQTKPSPPDPPSHVTLNGEQIAI